MENPAYFDLITLLGDVKEGLSDLFPDRVWVKAEIASVKVKSGGHCYLELVQSEGGAIAAKVEANIWRNNYAVLNAKFRKENGEDISAGKTVLVLAEVRFHPVFGFSLNITDIKAEFTPGAHELERQKTIERLTREGLLLMQKELSMPDLPYAFAVVSAPGAAGLQDFINHLQDNEFGFVYKVDFYSAVMQGDNAPQSICAALAEAASGGTRYDALLLLRGGGSDTDLSCFDDYSLCAAIARFPVPVFTAIGHDKDFHVADMVACEHVKTPTALADMIVGITAEADSRISSLEHRLALGFRARFAEADSHLRILGQRVYSAALRKVDSASAALNLIQSRISTTDPRNVLKRGFSLAVDSRGVKLTAASGTAPGESISVLFSDGRVRALVQEVSLSEENKKE